MTHISMTSGSIEGFGAAVMQFHCQLLERREGKREELLRKPVSMQAWQAAGSYDSSLFVGQFTSSYLRESGGKVMLALSGPLHAQLPCPTPPPHLSNSWTGVRKWGSCPSEVKYITRGHISLRASELWHPSTEKGFLSKNVKYHKYHSH